jgi:membrane protein
MARDCPPGVAPKRAPSVQGSAAATCPSSIDRREVPLVASRRERVRDATVAGMGVASAVDRFQRRHRVLGFPIAVVYKFFDDQGVYLAALITYYGFLSLFPLLLLLASVLGFVLRDDPDLQSRILDSTISQFPVIGEQLRDPRGLEGSGAALVVGAIVAIYGALGVAQALPNALNIAWAVPRNDRPNPLKARVRSVLILLTGGVAVLATTTVSVLAGALGAPGGVFDGGVPVVAGIAAVLANTVIFVVVFRIGTAIRTRIADVLPGAVLSAVLWQLMQLFGTNNTATVVKDSTPTYGIFALVLGLLGWVFFVALGVVSGIELNVVRAKRLYPRALLTPFTDDVDLTAADRVAYTDAARAQRHKGFEDVDVSFAHDGQFASARRRDDDAAAPDEGA